MKKYKDDISKNTLIEFGLKHFATKTYVEKIVTENRFSKHGSTLDECDELFEEYEDVFPNAINDKEQAFNLLIDWMPFRIKYIVNDIIGELNYYKTLYRSVYLSNDALEYIKNNKENITTNDIGMFWSTRKDTHPFGAENINPKHKLVKIKINLNTDDIDWYETLVSRIDYIHGEQEQEFRLLKDKQITIQEIVIYD